MVEIILFSKCHNLLHTKVSSVLKWINIRNLYLWTHNVFTEYTIAKNVL